MSRLLVVGNDDCTYNDILLTLNPCNSQVICEKLFHIAGSLGMEPGSLRNMELTKSQSPQNYDHYLALNTILNNYRSLFSNSATLENLISALRKHNCYKAADDLCKSFNISLPLQPQPSVSHKPPSFQGSESISDAKENFTETIIEWANQIQNSSSFHDINAFLLGCTNEDLSSELIQKSLKIAYDGDLINFINFDRFISEIPTNVSQHCGYASLFSLMMENDHGHTEEMMKFVYRIKIAIEKLSSGEQNISIINKYYELKNNLPKAIKAIMFGHPVTIRNNYYVKYMYESGKLVKSGSTFYRIVFTWEPDEKVVQSVWHFDVKLLENGQLYFFIRNDYHEKDSPLSLSSEWIDDERLKIVTRPNEPESNCCKWTVQPVKSASCALSFTIRNSMDGAFLYSPKGYNNYFYERFFESKLRRYVFCWKGDLREIINDPKAYWDIEEMIG